MSPAWSACTRATPGLVKAIVVPTRLATSGVKLLKATAKPLCACALSVVEAPSTNCVPSAGTKFVMAWSAFRIVSVVAFVACQFAASTTPVTAYVPAFTGRAAAPS